MQTTPIIIADDHQLVIDGIKSMLASHPNFEVVGEALNGQEAMDLIQASPEKYSILITDISMPLLSGIELCKMIKSQFPHIKVLILSMYSSVNVVKESIMAEADGYILKNAGKDKLLEALLQIDNDGMYYSEEIIPLIYSQIEKEKVQKENISILTPRELEILKLIVQELTSDEIANRLFLSKKTVDNHRSNILAKTGSKSTIALLKFAFNNGIE